MFQANPDFRDIFVELSYGSQPTEKLLLKGQLLEQQITAEFQALGNSGKIVLKRTDDTFNIAGNYNQDRIAISGKKVIVPGNYLLQVESESSIPALESVQITLQHKFDSVDLNTQVSDKNYQELARSVSIFSSGIDTMERQASRFQTHWTEIHPDLDTVGDKFLILDH